MLPTPAVQENLARSLRSKLSEDARRCFQVTETIIIIKITLNETIIRIAIFQETGRTIRIIFQRTEKIIPTAIDTIIAIIIIS